MQKQDIVGYRTPLDAARRYKLEKVKVLKVAEDGSVAEVMLKGDAKDGSKITLKADQIDLKGKNINLTGDDVSISSTNFNVSNTGAVTASSLALTGGSITLGNNFSVDSSGNMTCSNANVSGTINATSGTFQGTLSTGQDCTVGNNLYVGQNQGYSLGKYIYFNPEDYIRFLHLSYLDAVIVGGKDQVSLQVENSDIKVGSNYVKLNPHPTNSQSGDSVAEFEESSISFRVNPVIGSDKRLKKNIRKVDDTSWINDLKIKKYKYKKANDTKIGLIAQDYLEKDYCNNFIRKGQNDFYSIDYQNINMALLNEFQKQNKKIEKLEKRVEELERR